MSHPALRCVWCGKTFDGSSTRLSRRTRCAACGAATTDPWPTDAELEAAYGTWYRPEGAGRFSFAGDALLSRTRALLAGRIDRIAPPGPVLDVGAGDGTLLDALRRKGREATGLERNPQRPDFRDEPLEDIEGDGTWAAIIFWHSLEHLPQPGDAIREAARLLAPGGVIAVAVPNNGSPQARTFGDRWLHLDIPRHLVHLSESSLKRGLAGSGFAIERVSPIRGGQIVIGWLDGMVGALPGHLDLYAAVRTPKARSTPLDTAGRMLSILAGVVLLPLAAVCAIAEVTMRSAGTVYVEARLG